MRYKEVSKAHQGASETCLAISKSFRVFKRCIRASTRVLMGLSYVSKGSREFQCI